MEAVDHISPCAPALASDCGRTLTAEASAVAGLHERGSAGCEWRQ